MWSEFDFTREGGGRRTTRERKNFPSWSQCTNNHFKTNKTNHTSTVVHLFNHEMLSPVVQFAIQQKKIVTLCFCAFQATCTNTSPPSFQAATIIMAMPLRRLLLVLLVASLGLVHAEDFPEGSIVRAAEPSEHDKHNPLFKVSSEVERGGALVSGEAREYTEWHRRCCKIRKEKDCESAE